MSIFMRLMWLILIYGGGSKGRNGKCLRSYLILLQRMIRRSWRRRMRRLGRMKLEGRSALYFELAY